MPRSSSSLLLGLLGVVANTFACVIPTEPLSNNITEPFQIFVQNPAQPIVHDKILNFRPNGLDMHLVLRPAGQDTYDTIWLENGYLRNGDRYAVIDLEYNPNDNTTKMFMTDRQYATAVFEAVYGCDPDTDELQIRIVLVKRQADLDEGQAEEDGGKIGIQEAGYTGVYEFRYSPANNSLLTDTWFDINMVIFRDGITPPTTTTTSAAATPTSPSTIADYEFISCWAEPADGSRTLTTVYTDPNMTNEMCAVDCAGSMYFGTQYFDECWCGAALGAGSLAAPATDCTDACVGDTSEVCGGARRLSLYQLVGNSSVTTTTSSAASSTSSSSSTSTPTPTPTPTPSPTPSSSSSSSTSSTTPTPTPTPTPSPTPTTLSTSTTSTTSSTSSTGSSTPTDLPSVGDYTFISCWTEASSGRTLSSAFEGSTTMTLETCAAFCSLHPYFGVEWSSECWCGDSLTTGSVAAPLSDCSYPCSGDSSELCGGSLRLSLYQNLAWSVPADPPTLGNYTYYGCVTDSPARSLTAASLSSEGMTLEVCEAFCEGYAFWGTEWGVECYCGNGFASTAELVGDGDCSMVCAGDEEELCGNGDRLSVYELGADR